MEKVQKPSNSNCDTPSSEPFRIYLKTGLSYISSLICTEYESKDTFFFLILIVGVGVQLGPLGTSAPSSPIVPTPGDYEDGQFGWTMIGRGTEVVGENLPQCNFVHHKSHMIWLGTNPGRCDGKPATNRLSSGTA
jgi:hypothetical protein